MAMQTEHKNVHRHEWLATYLACRSPVPSPAKRPKTEETREAVYRLDGWQELIPELMDRILAVSAQPAVKTMHMTSRTWRRAARESVRSLSPSSLTALPEKFPRIQSLDLCHLRPGACSSAGVVSALSGLTSLRHLSIGEDVCSHLPGTLDGVLPANLHAVSIMSGRQALEEHLAAQLGQLGSLTSMSLAGCRHLTVEWLERYWAGSGSCSLRGLDLSGCCALADRNGSPWGMDSLLSGLGGLHSLKMDGLGFCLPLSIFQGLTALEALSLEGTHLPGLDSVVPSLSCLTSLNVASNLGLGSLSALSPLAETLRQLNLSDCLLEDKDLHELPCLPSLGTLCLAGNPLSGELACLLAMRTPQVETLHADGLGEEWSPEQMWWLTKLRRLSELSIDSVAVTSEASMRALVKAGTGLRCLSLSGSRLTNAGLAALQGMTGLHSLRLHLSEMSYAAGGLSGLTRLTSLDLVACSGVLPAICCMGGLSGLQALRLSRCSGLDHPTLGPALAMFLPRLSRLSVEQCDLTDQGAAGLSACCLLTELSLAGNSAVGGHGVTSVLQSLVHLSVLDISGLPELSTRSGKSFVHPNAAIILSHPAEASAVPA